MQVGIVALLVAVVLYCCGPARSAEVLDCGPYASADLLVEPWEETTRTFSRGTVRLAVVDLGEPPCCPKHLLVLIPANMYGGRICALVARNVLVPNGWAKIGIAEAEAFRTEAPGLRLRVPVYDFDPRTGAADLNARDVLKLVVRQAAGTVELAAE